MDPHGLAEHKIDFYLKKLNLNIYFFEILIKLEPTVEIKLVKGVSESRKKFLI